MKYRIIVSAGLMPFAASCASRESTGGPAQGVAAIYSPPVRLGGQGAMNFFQAPKSLQDAPPLPPGEVLADYSPGPWSIFFEANSDRPASNSKPALEQIAFMVSRFPAVGVKLCFIGSPSQRRSSIEDHKRVQAVRVLLSRAGVRRVVAGSNGLCKAVLPRSEPFAWVTPAMN